MDRFLGQKSGWRNTAKRAVIAGLLLSVYILANVFFLNSFDNWHFRNLYAAQELSTINCFIVLYGVEFVVLSLFMWNWNLIRSVIVELSSLCVLVAFGISAVVFLFPISVPQFHVPQAVFLTLITGYFMLFVSARINISEAEDRRLSRLSGGIRPSVSFKSYILLGSAILGGFSLIVLYSLIMGAKKDGADIAYAFAGFSGVVCAWIVRENLRVRLLHSISGTGVGK